MTTAAIEAAQRPAAIRPSVGMFLGLGLLAVAIPPLMVRLAPLLDWPNHIVRIWLLAGGTKVDPVASMYAVDWGKARTNVGLDMLAQALGVVLPAGVIAPLFLTLAMVLPPLGAALLHRRLFGLGRWWAAAAPMAAWGVTLLAGFVNYQVGLGLALIAASFDPVLKARLNPVQLFLVRALIAAGLLVSHLFALGFYGALLAGLTVGPKIPWRRLHHTAMEIALAAAAVLSPLLVFRLTAAKLPGRGSWFPLIWGPTTLKYKIDVLLCSFATYDVLIDLLFFAPLAAAIGWAAAKGRLGAHAGLLLAAFGLAVMALVVPTWAAQTGYIDTRLPVMALLILFAALDPRFEKAPRIALALAAGLAVLVAARSAWIGSVWVARQSDLASMEAALSRVPAGAAVLPVDHLPSRRGMKSAPVGRYFHFGMSYYHYFTWAVMQRRAFSPLVFAEPGKQPIQVLQPWGDISAPNGGRAPSFWVLRNPPPIWLRDAPYLRHWRTRFDYALMLNADVLEDVRRDPVPDNMSLVADHGFARLYKIDRAPEPAS